MAEEAILQREVSALLSEHGWLVVRINSGLKGYINFVSWLMPRDWAGLLDQEDLADIFPNKNLVEVMNSLDRRQSRGFSDLMAARDGRVMYLEVKQGRRKPTPEQRLFMLVMQRMGFVAEVVTSVDEVRGLIDDLRKRDA